MSVPQRVKTNRIRPIPAELIAFCLFAAIPFDIVSAQPSDAPIDFSRQIQPILARQCFSCHGPGHQEAGLKLNRRDSALEKLDSGKHAIVPGKPDESELLRRLISTDEGERMPPSGKPVSPQNIELIRKWIAQGAKWDEHYAFTPLKSVEPPKVDDPAWSRNPIDAFVYSRLQSNGLKPSPPADRVALLRRATYDLTGLPPSPAEVDAFLKNDSPKAWEDLIDRLLASEHYGERWGRHWLDLVRFAESNSYERDGVKPNAWRYRDYVIRSFNADKPYDRFVLEQLAGDELPDRSPETLIAAGFLRLGVWQDEPVDAVQSYYDEMDDVVTTVSQAFLGLTVNCARCHDHKIDPMLQADYYKILAFFHDVPGYASRGDERTNNQLDISSDAVNAAHTDADRARRELRDRMEPIEKRGIVKMSAEDQRKTEGRDREKVLNTKLKEFLADDDWKAYAELKKSWDELAARPLPPRESAMTVARHVIPPPETFIFGRGNPQSRGDKVQPGYPGLFESSDPKFPELTKDSPIAGRRTEFARWLTSAENRLAPRVLANRIWQFHFGRGIVRTPNNFGLLGEPATHPQLLDWLAVQLRDGLAGDRSTAWRLKSLHRQIMLSKAYQMSSKANPEGLAKDPRNDLFWRFDMRRLSAEEIRDSVYAVTGKLNPKMYGPGTFPEISPEVLAGQSVPGQGWGKSSPEEAARRAVYIHVKRSLVTPMLSAFDFPDTDTTCEARFTTTQPAQALGLMNGKFFQERAAEFADRLRREAGVDPTRQVALAYRLALQRPIDQTQVARGVELLKTLRAKHNLDETRTLNYFCLAVLNLNEFVYLD